MPMRQARKLPFIGSKLPLIGKSTMRYMLATAVLALCGCTPSVGVRPSAPLQIVHTRYIPIPASLLQPCTAPQASIRTWGDLAQAYITLHAAYLQCAAQVQAIAQTQTKGKP